MRRPTVLHVVEHWGRPSERFVTDLVRSTTSTRAVVAACHVAAGAPGAPAGGRVHDLSACAGVGPADPHVPVRPAPRRSLPLRGVPLHAAVAAVAVVERAAVVHAHFGQMANVAWRAARRLRLPLAVSVHGWDVLVGARSDPGIVEALQAADLVVAPSHFLADRVRALGVSGATIRVVPSGLDLAELPWRERAAPEGVPLATFAGRFTEKKGVLDIARALAQVADHRPLRARFVGYGPLEGSLRAVLAASTLDAEVWDGRAPGAVRAAIDATDVVVTASRTAADGDAETLCLVNLEAQACGAPLVSTRHGGIPEAVDPASAVLVPDDGDVTGALARAVDDLLAHPARWAAMGRAGRRFVAGNFELGARTADMEQLWQALAGGARGAGLPRPAPDAGPPPRASVVLVTHDRRDLLDRTLDALAAQTHPPEEVLVVDNGSADGTADLLAARAAAGSPAGLRVLTRPANLPVAEGRNLAVAEATGEVIAFTDDDCRPRPTWLEALLAGLRPDVGIVQGRTTADPAQPLEPLSRTQWTPAEFGLYETCNVAYRRAALHRAGPPAPTGPFDTTFAATVARVLGERWARYPFGEDTELAWRVKRAGAGSRFAVHAVVDHEVSPPDPALLLRRAALAAAFPVLVREVPELREVFLWRRLVLGPHRARLWLAAAATGTALATRRPGPLLLAAPYAADVVGLRELRRRGGRRARVRAAGLLVRRDLAETAALLRGSWRARTPVL